MEAPGRAGKPSVSSVVARVAAAEDGALDGVVGEDAVFRQAGAADEQGLRVQDALPAKPPRPVRSCQTSPQAAP